MIKTQFILTVLICSALTLCIGYYLGNSLSSNKTYLPQNIRVHAKLLINKVSEDEGQSNINLTIKVNDDMSELVKQQVINAIY